MSEFSKEELLEIFDQFLDEENLYLTFKEWLDKLSGYTPQDLGLREEKLKM